MANISRKVVPYRSKGRPRKGTWIRIDRPYRRQVSRRGQSVMIMGTVFEESYNDKRATLIHLLYDQKQYAISLLQNGMLEVVALSGLDGLYEVKGDGGERNENAVWVMAKDDKELIVDLPEEVEEEE